MQPGDEHSGAPDPEQRDEQTLDRELSKLTSERRTLVPGATVLLAFLLSVPFASGFPTLGGLQQAVYFAAFLSIALAVVFLLGEAARHRLRGEPYDKGLLITTTGRQLLAALLLLGVALTSVVLVTDVLFGLAASVPLTAGIVVLLLVIWFGLPLQRRLRAR